MGYKIPESVLVVIRTAARNVPLIGRADTAGDYGQSVRGGKATPGEPLKQTAMREVREEAGIDGGSKRCRRTDWHIEHVYPLDPRWKRRFAPEVTHNTEQVFGLLVPDRLSIRLNPREHTQLHGPGGDRGRVSFARGASPRMFDAVEAEDI